MNKDVQVMYGKSRATFTPEERRRIVEESLASPLSANQFSKKLGISPATLCVWKKELGKSELGRSDTGKFEVTHKTATTYPQMYPEFTNLESVLSENTSLKAENAKLRQFKEYAVNKIFALEASQYV